MNKLLKRVITFLLSFVLLLQCSFPNILADTVANGTSNDNVSNNQTVSNTVYQATSSTMAELKSKLVEGLKRKQRTMLVNYTGPDITSQIILGDLNGDKIVDSKDSSIMKSYLLGNITDFPSEYGFIAADVNGDGTINSIDLALLKRYTSGSINKFSAIINLKQEISDLIQITLKGDANRYNVKSSSFDISGNQGSYFITFNFTYNYIPKYICTDYPDYLLECGTEQTVSFCVYDDCYNSVPNQECKITVTGSAVADDAVVTDQDGSGTINITDNTEEDIILNIETSNGVKISVPVSFVILPPEYIDTQYTQYFFECDSEQTVNFCVYNYNDNGVANEKCNISVSGSAVVNNNVVTDENGMGTIAIMDDTQEDVTLTIETSNGITLEIPISFVKPVLSTKPEIKLTKEHGNIVLRWDSVKDADFYEVKRKVNNGEYVNVDDDIQDCFYTDANIESGNQYSYIVNAVNAVATSQDSNEVSTEYTAPMDNLGKLTADKVTAFTNESTPVTINIALTNKIAGANGIQLIDSDSTDKKVVGIMYDDGNANNGDSVKGDGIYSCKVNINEAQSKNLHLKAYVSTNVDDSIQDIYSENTIELNVISKFTQQELTNTKAAISTIEAVYNKVVNENSNATLDVIAQNILASVNKNNNSYVADSGISSGTTSVWYLLKSGIKYVVPLTAEGTNGSGSEETLSFDYSNSKSTYPTYETITNDFSKSGYNANLVEDSVVLSSFKNLDSNSAILINCHGSLYNNEPYICTSQVADQTSIIANAQDLKTGKITVVRTAYGDYFGVLPDYIRSYNKTLSNSVVFLGSCQGLAKEDMAQAFYDLGAKTVFGFDNDVYKDYAAGCAKVIFKSMLDDGQTAGQAYNNTVDIMKDSDNTWKGANTKPAAHLKLYGDSESTLANGRNNGDLVNGDFENGTMGWTTSGNASIVSQYQDIKPISGNNMAMLSDSSDSFIEQRIYVPQDATTVSFDCYGLSEQPVMLSLNKNYQDGLEFELTSDDYGSISDTGYYSWNDSIDVHNYQGRYVTLRFHVPAYGASEGDYDKKLIIDNIRIDGTPTQAVDDNSASDNNQDEKEYLMWPTDSTQIIAHNEEDDNKHIGIDIQGNQGDEVCAAAEGEVVFAGQKDGYGNVVIINSEYQNKNIQIRYSNLQSISVETGDYVFEGDTLGIIGSTDSSSTSPAILHFEMLQSTDGNECEMDGSNTVNMDPEDYLFPYYSTEDSITIIPDASVDTMGLTNDDSGKSKGFVYIDTLAKMYGSEGIKVKYFDGNGKQLKQYDKDKKEQNFINDPSILKKVKKITIRMPQHSPKNYKGGEVPFLIIAKRTYAYNKLKLISDKLTISIDDFTRIFYPGTYNKNGKSYPGTVIDVSKKEGYNPYIEKVRQRLHDLKYDGENGKQLSVNNLSDDDVLIAINAFKKINHIDNSKKNYGKIGPKTWKVLFSDKAIRYKVTNFKAEVRVFNEKELYKVYNDWTAKHKGAFQNTLYIRVALRNVYELGIRESDFKSYEDYEKVIKKYFEDIINKGHEPTVEDFIFELLGAIDVAQIRAKGSYTIIEKDEVIFTPTEVSGSEASVEIVKRSLLSKIPEKIFEKVCAVVQKGKGILHVKMKGTVDKPGVEFDIKESKLKAELQANLENNGEMKEEANKEATEKVNLLKKSGNAITAIKDVAESYRLKVMGGFYKNPNGDVIKPKGCISVIIAKSDTSKQYFGWNGITKYNPTIIEGERFVSKENYLNTLSNEYIDELNNKNPNFFKGKNIDKIRLEMGKFRDKIAKTKGLASKDTKLVASDGTPSYEIWPVENCAEIWAVRNAILDGVELDDMVIRSINSDGSVKPLCGNCEKTFSDITQSMGN